MSAYEALAGSYDALTQDVPYEAILDYVEALLARHGRQPETVLDLACGTGSLAALLARKGYRVLAADASEEMLSMAYDKAQALDLPNPPFFICQRMEQLTLPEPVDLVVCTLDSLNYLTDPQDARRALGRIYEALKPGGAVIFDINTPEKLRGLDGQVFLDEDKDTYCVWRAEFDEAENICYYGMDLFQRRGRLWQRSFEEHREYAYTPEELETYLREAGFQTVCRYGDRSLEPPAPGAQRIYFYGEKQSPEGA